ncbi:PREDICTED: myb-binding protein 1A-like isoform X2 [Camelina sativa]|uniref:Myb-binding protein 1A-like isoform X2 n=1 Tax=Camelina sativa TaxID=90675 RepID=A0ABM0VVQ4_CAMSA|nr:PREDICTED: myb-binding protein 1A-like isoform X2 [Camelina sativa]
MGSKKRSSDDSTEVLENNSLTDSSIVKTKKPKKTDKMNTDSDTAATAAAEADTAPGVASSGKDMEKKKKRRASDKERKLAAALEKNDGVLLAPRPNPKPVAVNSNSDEAEADDESLPAAAAASSSSSSLPLNYFTDLASSDASVREAAAESLVLKLQEIQKQYEMLPDKESADGELMLEAEKNDGLDNCAPHLRYALRRLIRGVSSSRECARQGFALGLTLPLSVISSINLESLLNLIVESLSISSSMKGQDIKECLLGRLFAYGALARSGRLIEDWQSDNDSQILKEFTNALIGLAAKKRYLQEPAVHVLLDLVDKLPIEPVVTHVMEAPELHKWFEQATEVGNPDALLLALKLREKISVDHPIFSKLLPVPFSSAKFFSADHLSAIGNCLKESTFCQPRVHSLWSVICDMLLPEAVVQSEDVTSVSSSSKKQKRNRKSSPVEEEATNNIRNFYELFVDGVLLSSSHDRKHLAFDILLRLLPKLPASFVQHVLSLKFVQCLMDILSTKESWLHKVATNFLVQLMDWVKDDTKRVAVTMALQKHSEGKFDTITRTKTVKGLAAEFETEDGCTLFIQNLMNLFVDEQHVPEEPSNMKWSLEPCSLNSDQSQTTDDNSEIGSNEEKDSVGTNGNSDVLKSWVIESLPGILKHAKLSPEAKLRVQKQILKFLAVQGLFLASLGTEVTSFELQEKFKWPKTATPVALCKMCIEQLQLLLSNSQKIENPVSKGNGLEQLDDPVSYFMKFLSTLQNIPSVSLFRSLNEADEKAFKKLQETESKLSKEEKDCGSSADANKFHALRHLVVQLLLQILLHPGEFSEAASELSVCCDKAFSSLDLPKSDGEGEADGEDEPAVMDVLLDTLLSLLPHSSAPMRSSIEQFFKYFCQDVTTDGVLRMLRVIKKDLKPARHQEDQDSEDLDDDEDCLAIEDEEEEIEEMGETGESDEQTDDSETVTGVVPMAVDREGPDNSDDSDDDDGMDDDAMFRMDTYLAQIFKEKRNQAGGETAQSQLVLFKLRVLSLLEIYLHENPDNPQVMTVYLNLAQALVNPSTAESSLQLLQRIWGIIQKKIFKAKEYPKDESMEFSALASLLEKNLKLAVKPFKSKSVADPSKKKQSAAWNRHKMITNLGQNSTYWVMKIIDSRKFSETELEKILDLFRSVVAGYFDTRKSQMKIEFLEEVFRRRPWVGHKLFGFLLEKSGNAKFEFRRVEALELISETLRSLVPINETALEDSKKTMKTHLKKLSHLIKELVANMPENKARRGQVRKFCARIFQMVSLLKLTNSLLKSLGPDGQTACETAVGDLFLNFKNTEH